MFFDVISILGEIILEMHFVTLLYNRNNMISKCLNISVLLMQIHIPRVIYGIFVT